MGVRFMEQDAGLPVSQQKMHKDFFDKCDTAIENGFYFEAILLEYAALESRLEVILGILQMPCNKDLESGKRKDIKISHRIQCLNYMRKHSPVFENTKLEKNFFEKNHLVKWIKSRNIYIHGLYKNGQEYENRKAECKELAIQGREYCRLLYNEAKRLNRLLKNHPDAFEQHIRCCRSKSCIVSEKKTQ